MNQILKVSALLCFTVFFLSSCALKPRDKSDITNLETLFVIALASEDESYLNARNKILDIGNEALPYLYKKSVIKNDWRTNLVADMLITCISEASLCNEVSKLMQGYIRTKGLPFALNKESSESARGVAIAALGPKAIPRILEILIKTKEYSNATELGALLIALGKHKDARTITPLIEFLRYQPNINAKIWTTTALGQIGHPQALDILSENLQDSSNDMALRTASAEALGLIKDPRVFWLLLKIAANDQNDTKLRMSAIWSLTLQPDKRAPAALAKQLLKEKDQQVQLELITALAEIGNKSSLSALNHMIKYSRSKEVRNEAVQARNTLQQKLRNR
jgi:hypothetical protein